MLLRALTFVAIATGSCLGLTASADAATTWYASPGGSGTTCTQPAPCPAPYAIATKAQNGDTVSLAGGDYDIAATMASSNAISVEGASSGAPTRLIGGPSTTYTLIVSTSAPDTVHITDVYATNQAVAGRPIFVASNTSVVLDRVYGDASGSNGVGLSVLGATSTTVRNSIGRTTGTTGIGLLAQGSTSLASTIDVRNVVGDSRGSGGFGIYLAGGSLPAIMCGNLTATMKNSVARSAAGATSDLYLSAGIGIVPCSASLASATSSWRSTISMGIASSSDQHSSDPLYVNAAAGDYHQLPGSPTIDAGSSDNLNGPLDLDRRPRSIGAAPDVGPYEFADQVAPAISAFKLTPKKFRAQAPKVPSIAKTGKGAAVAFQLSEVAALKFTVERASTGRKKGKKCSSKAKSGKKCTIYKAVKGSFPLAGAAGSNGFKFTGYVNGKALKPGVYRLAAVATDPYGNASAKSYAGFKIVH